ncbi:sigma 54-interacting transcriptional regulator [Candidatus Dependentiae bacterium]|nr:sigma 54-interacting transcriptional regulator [Candidatus Dependentiae bacterium]
MNIFLAYFPFFSLWNNYFFEIANTAISSIIVQTLCFFILLKVIYNLLYHLLSQPDFKKKQYQFIFFIIPTIAIMFENISWIAKFLLPKTTLTRIIICFAWILACFKFHSFAIFLEKLTEKNKPLQPYHKLLFFLEIILSFGFIADCSFLISYNQHITLFNYFEQATFLIWFMSLLPSIMTILNKLTESHIPIILKKQLKILFLYLVIPHLICLLLEFLPKIIYQEHQSVAFASLGIIFITSTLYFCYQRIMQFRFLNFSDQIQIPNTNEISFAPNIKEIIDSLNFASHDKELHLITQNFFQEQLDIAKNRVELFIRDKDFQQPEQNTIELFLNNERLTFHPLQTITHHKILVGHEIDFDAFYSNNQMVIELSNFLKSIQSDIFLPILNNKKLIAYIIIKKDKSTIIYSLEQQNKMIIFAQLLSPAIHLLSQKNFYKLMQEAKETKEDLYTKHQEVNQYKESIKKLLKDRIENHIGIIFYKQKHFSFRNQEAQQLIGLNLNLQPNHPTTATFINLAQQVEKFKTTQSMFMTMHNGNKLIITAMPYADSSSGILIIVRQPEATDIIKMQLDALKDPSKRDYLLYLETTDAGKIINKLLPSKHESILNLKVELLQAALQKNALLLQSHADDIVDIATIIHQISLKEIMHIIDLQGPATVDCSIKLFGINQLLQSDTEPALLEKLNGQTLLIKNIEYLDHLSQQKLAHFLRYGIFTPLKSEQRKLTDVRIICSTEQNLQNLAQSGKIIPDLNKELQKSALNFPSLLNLAQNDLYDLIDGFMYQALYDEQEQLNTPLNIKDKDYLLEKRIESIHEFKKKIHHLMRNKANSTSISQETLLSKKPLAVTMCPELQLAAKLGKDALKDSKLMSILWEKLGSQTKIAELLGVNRSSVNRRCKDYNLL